MPAAPDLETRIALLEQALHELRKDVKEGLGTMSQDFRQVKKILYGNGGWEHPGLIQQVRENQKAIAELLTAIEKRDRILLAVLLALFVQAVTGFTVPDFLRWMGALLGVPVP